MTTKPVARLSIRPATMDPAHSYDVIDRSRRNEWGRPYCIAAAVTLREAEQIVSNQNHPTRQES